MHYPLYWLTRGPHSGRIRRLLNLSTMRNFQPRDRDPTLDTIPRRFPVCAIVERIGFTGEQRGAQSVQRVCMNSGDIGILCASSVILILGLALGELAGVAFMCSF